MDKITEKTLVPLSLCLAVATAVFSLSAYFYRLESIAARQDKTEIRVDKIEDRENIRDKEIIDRLARIEEKLRAITISHSRKSED